MATLLQAIRVILILVPNRCHQFAKLERTNNRDGSAAFAAGADQQRSVYTFVQVKLLRDGISSYEATAI